MVEKVPFELFALVVFTTERRVDITDDRNVQSSDWFDEHFNVRNHAGKLAQMIEAVHRKHSSAREREPILAK